MNGSRRWVLTAAAALLCGSAVQAERQGGRGGGRGGERGIGTVVSVDSDAQSFVVQPKGDAETLITVSTTAETQVVKSDGAAATFADILVGVEVCVEGTVTDATGVTAARITIKVADGPRRVTGDGIITSVDAGALSFVVQPRGRDAEPVTVITTSDTQIVKSDGTAGTFADIVAGAKVDVTGTAVDSTVTATRVELVRAKGGKKKPK